MLQGPNLSAIAAVCSASRANIIASGGIRNASDIRRSGHWALKIFPAQ